MRDPARLDSNEAFDEGRQGDWLGRLVGWSEVGVSRVKEREAVFNGRARYSAERAIRSIFS